MKEFPDSGGRKVSTRGRTPLLMASSRVALRTGIEGPKLYAKTIESLDLYASTQFNNGSDVRRCLTSEKLVKPEVHILAKNHISHKKRVWE